MFLLLSQRKKIAEREMPDLSSIFDGPCSCLSCYAAEAEMPELEFGPEIENLSTQRIYEIFEESLNPTTVATMNFELEQLSCATGPSFLPSAEESPEKNQESVYSDDSCQIVEDEQTVRELWVVGHSYIHWAHNKALQVGMENLGCDPNKIRVVWVVLGECAGKL